VSPTLLHPLQCRRFPVLWCKPFSSSKPSGQFQETQLFIARPTEKDIPVVATDGQADDGSSDGQSADGFNAGRADDGFDDGLQAVALPLPMEPEASPSFQKTSQITVPLSGLRSLAIFQDRRVVVGAGCAIVLGFAVWMGVRSTGDDRKAARAPIANPAPAASKAPRSAHASCARSGQPRCRSPCASSSQPCCRGSCASSSHPCCRGSCTLGSLAIPSQPRPARHDRTSQKPRVLCATCLFRPLPVAPMWQPRTPPRWGGTLRTVLGTGMHRRSTHRWQRRLAHQRGPRRRHQRPAPREKSAPPRAGSLSADDF